jgi:hypothetical protein
MSNMPPFNFICLTSNPVSSIFLLAT